MKDEHRQFYKEVGQRLKEARKAKGYTQQQVGDMLGIGRSRVTQHEVGQCGMPQTTAQMYAKLYEISMDYILGTEISIKENPFKEFENVEFSFEEISDIKNYINYVISKRGE